MQQVAQLGSAALDYSVASGINAESWTLSSHSILKTVTHGPGPHPGTVVPLLSGQPKAGLSVARTSVPSAVESYMEQNVDPQHYITGAVYVNVRVQSSSS